MSISTNAYFDGNVFKPEESLINIESNRYYIITVKPLKTLENDEAFNLTDLAVNTGVRDLATNHDDYYYH
jgi:hypothetical protein